MGKKQIKAGNDPAKTRLINPTVAGSNSAKEEETGNDKLVLVCIKYLQSNFQCFSEWTDAEMRKFWDFNKRLHEMTWQQVLESGGKGKKSGIACTVIPQENYRKINNVSPEVTMFELRIDDKLRVHGFRQKSVFYLCFLDREHKVCNS